MSRKAKLALLAANIMAVFALLFQLMGWWAVLVWVLISFAGLLWDSASFPKKKEPGE